MKGRIAAWLVAMALLGPSGAFAQAYPNKAVRIIVPFPAGGWVDVITREVARRLEESFHQPFVVLNRPGAGGIIGRAEVGRALPDGYTLLTVFDSDATYEYFYNQPYGYRAFDHISLIATSPLVLLGAPNFPPDNLTALINYAKKNPGAVTYASLGVGTSPQLNALLFSSLASIRMQSIPYKGGTEAFLDLRSGRLDTMFSGSVMMAADHIKAQEAKAYAVTSPSRIPQLPDVPAMAEMFPEFISNSWMGLAAPVHTPPEVIARLSDAIADIARMPEIREKYSRLGFDIRGSSPEQFSAFVASESKKWGRVIRENSPPL